MKKLVRIMLLVLALMMPMSASAAAQNVPQYLNYQSMFFDDGGNFLPDGQTNLTFRIMSADGSVLFEEYQTVNVINGYVSAIVGNGLDVNDAPIGGIPMEVLSPDNGSLYLEVTAEGYPPEIGLEIVSVPYALYSQKALTVANNSIGAEEIKDNSIERSHLTVELISQLADEMGTAGLMATPTDITNLQTTYSSSSGATNIGMSTGLTYSTGTNVQTVVQDLDRAVLDRQNNIIAHANTDVVIAHPNGTIPLNRLDTDVCTQTELEGHTHTGGADGPKLNGHAFWVDSGGVVDNTYVSVAAGFDVNNCEITLGVYSAGNYIHDMDNTAVCARYCKEGNGYRIRCRTSSMRSGASDCSGFYGDNNIEGTDCSTTPDFGDECHASYMIFCPR